MDSDRLREQLASLNKVLNLGDQKLTETSTVGQLLEAIDKEDCVLMLVTKDEMVISLVDLFSSLLEALRKQ